MSYKVDQFFYKGLWSEEEKKFSSNLGIALKTLLSKFEMYDKSYCKIVW